ncbi:MULTISPECIES: hypothetical protein [Burkholderia]|uniref:hypothetical protein n=1 Tax=Burkholderia TaxID=32008 RepID=UPI000F5F8B9A|nr:MULTISPECIES: hypothetical protein [Burkholderia]
MTSPRATEKSVKDTSLDKYGRKHPRDPAIAESGGFCREAGIMEYRCAHGVLHVERQSRVGSLNPTAAAATLIVNAIHAIVAHFLTPLTQSHCTCPRFASTRPARGRYFNGLPLEAAENPVYSLGSCLRAAGRPVETRTAAASRVAHQRRGFTDLNRYDDDPI